MNRICTVRREPKKRTRVHALGRFFYASTVQIWEKFRIFVTINTKTTKMKRILLALSLLFCILLPSLAQVRSTVSILGDSYSTFEGFIPKENEIWYFNKLDTQKTDVNEVEQTWWWQVIKNAGYKLGVNNSWSGATICNEGYNDEDYTPRSFVTRSAQLGSLGCPDIILVCGATNDNWANVKMGDYEYDNWTRPDLYYFRPALAKMFVNLQQHYPNTKIYFILNSELKKEINESVRTVCRHYGIPLITLHDIDKQNGHPTVKGMKAIATQVLERIGK